MNPAVCHLTAEGTCWPVNVFATHVHRPLEFAWRAKSCCPAEIVSPLFKPAQEAKHVGVDLGQMPAQSVCIVIEHPQRAVPASRLNALLNDRQLLNIAGRIQGSMENLDRDSNMAGPFHGDRSVSAWHRSSRSSGRAR